MMVRNDEVLLAEQYLKDATMLDEAQLLRLRDAAYRALPSHDEQFSSYWWSTNIFGPLAAGRVSVLPDLSDPERQKILAAARDLTERDGTLQKDLDRIASLHGFGRVPAEDSPYTTLWAIVDKKRFSEIFERLRGGELSPDAIERLLKWTAEIADTLGVRCPFPP